MKRFIVLESDENGAKLLPSDAVNNWNIVPVPIEARSASQTVRPERPVAGDDPAR